MCLCIMTPRGTSMTQLCVYGVYTCVCICIYVCVWVCVFVFTCGWIYGVGVGQHKTSYLTWRNPKMSNVWSTPGWNELTVMCDV